MSNTSQSHANDAVALEARLTKVEGAVSNIVVSIDNVSKQLSTLSADVNAQRKPNWTALGLTLAVITGLWTLGTQPISQRVSMNEQAVIQATQSTNQSLAQITQNINDISAKVAVSAVNDAQSMADRQKLNLFVEKLIESQADNREKISHLNVAVGEVETQLKDHENSFGLVTVHLEKEVSRLYEKIFKQRYPSDLHFVPSIAKQRDMGLQK